MRFNDVKCNRMETFSGPLVTSDAACLSVELTMRSGTIYKVFPSEDGETLVVECGTCGEVVWHGRIVKES